MVKLFKMVYQLVLKLKMNKMNTIIFLLGVHFRFWFFKTIKKPKSIDYLYGNIDNLNNVDQNLLNMIVGYIIFVSLSLLGAYFVFTFF